MGSRVVRKATGSEPSRPRLRGWSVGFLTLTLGFLTVPATATPLEDGLIRLERLESERAGLVASADSIGFLLAASDGMRDPRTESWLKAAEGLASRSQGVDLEILLERERCRSLALQELAGIDRNSDRAAERESSLRDLLDGRLSVGFGGAWVVVEPDSIDGTETLLDKQAYLRDLRDRLRGVRDLVDRREDRLRRDQTLLRASEGFSDEGRFLDEGGRLGSDGTVRLHGLPGIPPGEGAARVSGTAGGIDAAEFPDRLDGDEAGPIDPAAALREIRRRVDRDLERIDASLEQADRLLRRAGVAGP